jgi:hypothetical protein
MRQKNTTISWRLLRSLQEILLSNFIPSGLTVNGIIDIQGTKVLSRLASIYAIENGLSA